MRVIAVSRRPTAAGSGRCRAVRLLHFPAAPFDGDLPNDLLLAGRLTRVWVRIFVLSVSADIEPEITGQRK